MTKREVAARIREARLKMMYVVDYARESINVGFEAEDYLWRGDLAKAEECLKQAEEWEAKIREHLGFWLPASLRLAVLRGQAKRKEKEVSNK